MFHEGIVCDACKVAVQPGMPYIRITLGMVNPPGENPLDLLSETPPTPVTCDACGVVMTDENEMDNCPSITHSPQNHLWSSNRRIHNLRLRRSRRSPLDDSIDYCMGCFRERAPDQIAALIKMTVAKE